MTRIQLRRAAAQWGHRIRRRLGPTQKTCQQAIYDAAFASDREAVTYFYALFNDHMPDFERPTWLNEKIRWQFLQAPNPLMSLAADKLAVRRYIEHCGTSIPAPAVIASGSDARELEHIDLPERFVLKSTHGSAQIHIEDGSVTTPRHKLVAMATSWIRNDFWRQFGELHYRDVPKGYLVEEYIPAAREKLEFKVFCFMGEPRFVMVVTERSGSKYRRVTHDLDWRRVDFATRGLPPDPRPVARPADLDLILAEARRLAAPFLFVRVDFLKFDGRLAFSELTFAPGAATLSFQPREANAEIGALMDLSRFEERLTACQTIAEELNWRGRVEGAAPPRASKRLPLPKHPANLAPVPLLSEG